MYPNNTSIQNIQPKSKNMKGSSYVADAPKFSFSPSFSKSTLNHSFIPCQSTFPSNNVTMKPLLAKEKDLSLRVQQQKGKSGFVVGCAKWGLERELEAEMKPPQEGGGGGGGGGGEEKGGSGMARFRDKCGEREGAVELLECLEKEAIMGEDMGKEPMDYNRRAQIFDTSSKVFQALKEFSDLDFPQRSP